MPHKGHRYAGRRHAGDNDTKTSVAARWVTAKHPFVDPQAKCKIRKEGASQETTLMRGWLAEMPGSVWLEFVMKRLGVAAILRASLVCNEWREASNRPELWKHLFLEVRFWRFWPAEATNGNGGEPPSQESLMQVCWKTAYIRRHQKTEHEGGVSWRSDSDVLPSETDDGSQSEDEPCNVLRVDQHENDPDGCFSFSSIQEAVDAPTSVNGTRIVVEPGTYSENGRLTVDKSIEIVGAGGKGTQIFIDAALEFTGETGRVANVNFRQNIGATKASGCVELQQGTRCVLEDCNVQGSVIVGGGSNPTVRHNVVHSSTHDGMVVEGDGSRGLITGNDLIGHGRSGVVIKDSAEPIVRHNVCSKNTFAGIVVGGTARGMLDSNQVTGNSQYGVAIGSHAQPVVRGNQCFHNVQGGIVVSGESKSEIDCNEMFGNPGHGLIIGGDAKPIATNNRLHRNGQAGILVLGNAQGTIENNRCFKNSGPGFVLQDVAAPTVRHNKMKVNAQDGVRVSDNSKGTFEGNTVAFNEMSGFQCSDDAAPMLKKNRIKKNGESGVVLEGGAKGTFRKNEIVDNQDGVRVSDNSRGTFECNTVAFNELSGFQCSGEAAPVLMKNRIQENGESGVLLEDEAKGTFRKNDIRDNQDGVRVSDNSKGTFEDNTVSFNELSGFQCSGDAAPVLQNNRIEKNGESSADEPKDEVKGTFRYELHAVCFNNTGDSQMLQLRVVHARPVDREKLSPPQHKKLQDDTLTWSRVVPASASPQLIISRLRMGPHSTIHASFKKTPEMKQHIKNGELLLVGYPAAETAEPQQLTDMDLPPPWCDTVPFAGLSIAQQNQAPLEDDLSSAIAYDSSGSAPAACDQDGFQRPFVIPVLWHDE